VLFALLLLLLKADRPVWSRAAAFAAFAAGCCWHLLMAALVQTPLTRPDVQLDSGAQVSYITHHPAALASAVLHTALHSGAQLVSQFIGVLGWLDTLLPKPYYVLALLVFLAAIAVSWSLDTKEGLKRPVWTLVILGLVKLGVYVALYVAYTPVGAALVDGIQGRYFLPVAAFLPVALVGTARDGEERSGEARRHDRRLALPLGQPCRGGAGARCPVLALNVDRRAAGQIAHHLALVLGGGFGLIRMARLVEQGDEPSPGAENVVRLGEDETLAGVACGVDLHSHMRLDCLFQQLHELLVMALALRNGRDLVEDGCSRGPGSDGFESITNCARSRP